MILDTGLIEFEMVKHIDIDVCIEIGRYIFHIREVGKVDDVSIEQAI